MKKKSLKNRKKATLKKVVREESASALGIRPLADRVLIKEEVKEDIKKTDAGILIPGTEKEGGSGRRGEIVAVGPGRFGDDNELVPMTLKKGDRVIFQWGEKVTIEGADYYVAREGDIIAVIN